MRLSGPIRRVAALALTSASIGQAFAQQAPDAGSLLRQAEPPRPSTLPTPSPAAPPAARRAPVAGPTIVVKRFEIEGNQRFTAVELAPVIEGFLNHPVTLSEIEIAAALLAQHYRNAGWLARVLVPPQQVDQGIVRLKVVEARMGETRFSADTDQDALRVSPQELQEWVLAGQATGQPVYLPGLERGLLLANDLPGIRLQGSQIAGRSEGETDVLLSASNEPLVYGDVSADNMGSRGTGAERLVARLGLNSAFGLGDQIDLQAQANSSMRYGRLAGTLPLGRQGLRAGLNVSALDYRVSSPRFAALDARGTSRNIGADLNYPLIRSAGRNLYLGASVEHKSFHNTTVAGVTSDYAIRNLVLKLDGNLIDSLGGGGINTGSLALTNGNVDLDGSPSQAADAATTRTQGRYRLLRYRLSRNQTLTPTLSLGAAFSGQATPDNLDSAEKFYLGGPYGVRAYPLNEGGGARGNLLNVDLRWQVPGNCGCTASLFYDRGNVTVNARTGFPGAPALNAYSLSGWGVGLTGQVARVNYTLTLARRIGSNPNAAPDGRDQDGSLRHTRVWASASTAF